MVGLQPKGRVFPSADKLTGWQAHGRAGRLRGCRPTAFSPTSVPEGFQRANGKPFGAPAGAVPLHGGLDAPTTARVVGLPPRGGQYFLSKRKKVPKKASGTATTGKRLLLPILTAGLFPSAAYRRSAPPPLGWGEGQIARVGMLPRCPADFAGKRQIGFPNHAVL